MWKIQHCVGNGYIKKMVMKGTLNCKELESYKSMLSFIRDTSWYDPVSLEITFSTQNNIY